MDECDLDKARLNPIVSIIIPCRNSGETIGRCLESIIHQTYSNLEILCIDDRSRDDTVEVIGSFSEKDERIVLTRNKKWLGTMGSRIKGIELASGEYICFVDSDDYVESNYVEALLNAICECDADIAFTKSQMINKDNEVDLDVPFKGIISSEEYREMFASSGGDVIQWYVVWGKIYRCALLKSIVPTIKPFENIQMCEDLIINGCLPLNVKNITSTIDTSYNYCINFKKGMTSSSTSFRNMKQYIKDTFDVVNLVKKTLTIDSNHNNVWEKHFLSIWKKRIDKTPKNKIFKTLLYNELKRFEKL